LSNRTLEPKNKLSYFTIINTTISQIRNSAPDSYRDQTTRTTPQFQQFSKSALQTYLYKNEEADSLLNLLLTKFQV